MSVLPVEFVVPILSGVAASGVYDLLKFISKRTCVRLSEDAELKNKLSRSLRGVVDDLAKKYPDIEFDYSGYCDILLAELESGELRKLFGRKEGFDWENIIRKLREEEILYLEDDDAERSIIAELSGNFAEKLRKQLLQDHENGLVYLDCLLSQDFLELKAGLSELREMLVIKQELLNFDNEAGLIFTPEFWEVVKLEADTESMVEYYTRIDSNFFTLLDVVAHDYYVKNKAFDLRVEEVLERVEQHQQKRFLLKILSQGGEGKSSYLLHLGKLLCERFRVIYLNRFDDDELKKLMVELSTNKEKKNVVLLDDVA